MFLFLYLDLFSNIPPSIPTGSTILVQVIIFCEVLFPPIEIDFAAQKVSADKIQNCVLWWNESGKCDQNSKTTLENITLSHFYLSASIVRLILDPWEIEGRFWPLFCISLSWRKVVKRKEISWYKIFLLSNRDSSKYQPQDLLSIWRLSIKDFSHCNAKILPK